MNIRKFIEALKVLFWRRPKVNYGWKPDDPIVEAMISRFSAPFNPNYLSGNSFKEVLNSIKKFGNLKENIYL